MTHPGRHHAFRPDSAWLARAQPFIALDTLADGLTGALRLSRALARADRPVDLTGLQDRFGLLCAKALDLAPEEGRLIAPRLMALRAELDLLAAALRDVMSDHP